MVVLSCLFFCSFAPKGAENMCSFRARFFTRVACCLGSAGGSQGHQKKKDVEDERLAGCTLMWICSMHQELIDVYIIVCMSGHLPITML